MKIAIGISTMNEGVFRALDNSTDVSRVCDIIICQQVTDSSAIFILDNYDLSSVNLITKFEKGLSRSRNTLLRAAIDNGYDFLIISDDDVKYSQEGLRELKENLATYRNRHLQFKSTNEHDIPRKKYKNHKFTLSSLDILKVSSIEMCLNLNLLKKKNIQFDESFGLGAAWPVGEEAVVLADIQNSGQEIVFLPISVTNHPDESTGEKLFYDALMLESRGVLFRRCYGATKGLVVTLLFWMRKFVIKPSGKNKFGQLTSLKLLIKGYIECGKSKFKRGA
ncbi:hypothetical protein [Winslowiella toletana]|uniref:hypothetical protein n=1 Tax=Winslowiella toletana TaxID=92490 RepID=UPI0028BED145|nr:hypothetical protein [Winslowiella toletana]WNN42967.1 hypothetical protein RIN69_14790 [Winslowiella toletana]